MVKEVMVSGKLTLKDMMAYQLYHNFSQVGGVFTGIFGLSALVFAPVMFIARDWIMAALLLTVALMYAVYTPLAFLSRAKRKIVHPVFKNTMTFRFGEEKMKIQLYSGSSEVLWEDVYQIRFFRDWVFIYLEPNQALILPGRFFVCEDDLLILKEFVNAEGLGIAKLKRMELEKHDKDIRDME